MLDRLHVLQGSRRQPVQLSDVEALAQQTARAYGHARIRLDPWQSIGLAQRLRARGLTVEEWSFTAQSVGRLGKSLHLLLRDQRLALPDDAELLDELLSVRLRESAPGVYRLDHDAGQHDDRAVALGLAALALTERSDSDRDGFSIPHEVAAGMGITSIRGRGAVSAGVRLGVGRPSPYDLRPVRGPLAAALAAQAAQTEAQRRHGVGLPVNGSANDPGRAARRR